MPGMSGLELQQSTSRKHGMRHARDLPLGPGGRPQGRAHAVKSGAIDFIEKALRLQEDRGELVRGVPAPGRGLARRARAEARRRGRKRLAVADSQREREVLEGVLAGKVSRVIAEEMAISASRPSRPIGPGSWKSFPSDSRGRTGPGHPRRGPPGPPPSGRRLGFPPIAGRFADEGLRIRATVPEEGSPKKNKRPAELGHPSARGRAGSHEQQAGPAGAPPHD